MPRGKGPIRLVALVLQWAKIMHVFYSISGYMVFILSIVGCRHRQKATDFGLDRRPQNQNYSTCVYNVQSLESVTNSQYVLFYNK